MNTQAQPLSQLALQTLKLVNSNPGQFHPMVLDTLSIYAHHPGAGYKLDLPAGVHAFVTRTDPEAHGFLNRTIRDSCIQYQVDMYAGRLPPVFPISSFGLIRLLIASIKRDSNLKMRTGDKMTMTKMALHLIKLMNFNPGKYSQAALENICLVLYHPGARYKLDPKANLGSQPPADRLRPINDAMRASCARYEADVYFGRIQPHVPISTKGLFRLLVKSIFTKK